MTFQSDQFSECTKGTFLLTGDEISFDYECEGFTTGIESPPGVFNYKYFFLNGKLSLTPIFISCIEGCGYRFEKIAGLQTEDL